jgi:hypothetical protein
MSCLCPDISIQLGRGGGYTLCLYVQKHKIGSILRLKRHIFTVKGHIFLCLCVFRNAPISVTTYSNKKQIVNVWNWQDPHLY